MAGLPPLVISLGLLSEHTAITRVTTALLHPVDVFVSLYMLTIWL